MSDGKADDDGKGQAGAAEHGRASDDAGVKPFDRPLEKVDEPPPGTHTRVMTAQESIAAPAHLAPRDAMPVAQLAAFVPPAWPDATEVDEEPSGASSPVAPSPRSSPSGRPSAAPETIRPAGPVQVRGELTADLHDGAARYARQKRLGMGGMGEVALHLDGWIGRNIARKTLRPGTAETESMRRRFLCEMQVQGQLEHPAIVPVYDFGVDGDERLFFTMRRVRGPTLEQILRALGAGDAEIAGSYSRRRLLTAFVSVCLAVHYAHTRGVLHRDLKPSNIMLGEFGEVYVLDWGVAKLLTDERGDEPGGPRAAGASGPGPSSGRSGDRPSDRPIDRSGERLGEIVGTPAYMAPEQLDGRGELLGAWSDVYSLGLILFEILCFERLHANNILADVRAVTAAGIDARPSLRAPDVPHELEAICRRALAARPGDRWATARDLAQSIERYLDGDRDLERRRVLAGERAAEATEGLARAAVVDARGDDSEAERAGAMQNVVEALALDPAQPEARKTLVRLLVEEPKKMPAGAEAEMAEAAVEGRREVLRSFGFALLTWLACAPLVAFLGVRSWAVFFAGIGVFSACALGTWRLAAARTLKSGHITALAPAMLLCTALLSAWLGPFVLVPTAVVASTLLISAYIEKRERPVFLATGALAVLVPFALEWLGLIPPSYRFEGGNFVLLPRAFLLRPVPTLLALLYTGATFVALPQYFVGRMRDKLRLAERRLFVHAWHLKRLLSRAEPGSPSPSAPPPPPDVNPSRG